MEALAEQAGRFAALSLVYFVSTLLTLLGGVAIVRRQNKKIKELPDQVSSSVSQQVSSSMSDKLVEQVAGPMQDMRTTLGAVLSSLESSTNSSNNIMAGATQIIELQARHIEKTGTQMTQMQRVMEGLNGRLNEYKKQLDSTQGALEVAAAASKGRDERIKKLEESLEGMTRQLADAEIKLKVALDELVKTRNELDLAKQRIEQIEKERGEERARLEGELDAERKKVIELQKQVDDQLVKIQQLEAEVADLRKQASEAVVESAPAVGAVVNEVSKMEGNENG